jgi:hypothetical protein
MSSTPPDGGERNPLRALGKSKTLSHTTQHDGQKDSSGTSITSPATTAKSPGNTGTGNGGEKKSATKLKRTSTMGVKSSAGTSGTDVTTPVGSKRSKPSAGSRGRDAGDVWDFTGSQEVETPAPALRGEKGTGLIGRLARRFSTRKDSDGKENGEVHGKEKEQVGMHAEPSLVILSQSSQRSVMSPDKPTSTTGTSNVKRSKTSGPSTTPKSATKEKIKRARDDHDLGENLRDGDGDLGMDVYPKLPQPKRFKNRSVTSINGFAASSSPKKAEDAGQVLLGPTPATVAVTKGVLDSSVVVPKTVSRDAQQPISLSSNAEGSIELDTTIHETLPHITTHNSEHTDNNLTASGQLANELSASFRSGEATPNRLPVHTLTSPLPNPLNTVTMDTTTPTTTHHTTSPPSFDKGFTKKGEAMVLLQPLSPESGGGVHVCGGE